MSERDWPWAMLDEVATVTAGNPAPQGTEFFDGGSRPFVRVQDLGRLSGASHLTETADLVNDRAAATLKLFPKGSVLFTKSGASLLLNQRAILGRDMHVVSHIGVAVPGPRITSEWLYYWLRTVDFADIAHGANMPSLPLARVKQVRVPVPPVPEQRRRIAEIEKQFSRLDEAVANLKRVKANLKRHRSSVLQAVTSGGLATEGRSVPRPKEWRWLTIDELASPAPRSIQSGPFGSNLRHSEFQTAGKLVIGIDNVCDGEFSIGSNHRISEAKFHELEKYAARPGDVLITVMATIGRVCVVPDDVEPAIITKHVYRITVNRELAVPDYVAIALRGSREVRAQLMDSVQGQTRPGLNGSLIKKIRVPLPPLVFQQSIVSEVYRCLSIVREVEAEVDENLKRAQALRQAALGRAFATEQRRALQSAGPSACRAARKDGEPIDAP